MANKSIVIDDGRQIYDIKDLKGNVIGEFTFVPTDSDLQERYKHTIAVFDEIVSILEKDKSEENQIKQTEKMKEEIDYLFNADVSNTFFSLSGPFTPLYSGQFYVENVIDAIRMVMEKEMNIRVDKVKSRASKYTSKYKKNKK